MAEYAQLLKRPLVTPITTALFAIVSFTGILMLLHVKSAMVKEFHEWVGLSFVVAAGVHLAVNWSCFASYLRKPLTIALAVVVVALVVLLLAGGESGRPGGRLPVMEIARRIEAASLAHAAPLFGVSVEESLTTLKSQGLYVSSEDERIADIARNNGKQAPEIISLLLAAGGKQDR